MQTKAIKQKIKSTGSIKKITRTMEMVSVAKMKKAVATAEGYKPFFTEAKKILSILSNLREKNDLALSNQSNKKLFIIIAGQKGLAGAYNTNIYRELNKKIKESKDSEYEFISIGKYAEKIARKFGTQGNQHIVSSFIGKDFIITDARTIVKIMVDGFLSKKYSSVYVVYTDFTNVNSQKTTTLQLLPFTSEELGIHENENTVRVLNEYTFEPNADAVYEMAVKVILVNSILASVERARAAEHAARMMAMKTATDNASEMLEELKLYYNKVRQAAITQEIAEISSGAMALNKG